jgi:hypothetical protein
MAIGAIRDRMVEPRVTTVCPSLAEIAADGGLIGRCHQAGTVAQSIESRLGKKKSTRPGRQ